MTLVMSTQKVAAATADTAVAEVVNAGALSTITDASAAAKAVILIARAPARVQRPTTEETHS